MNPDDFRRMADDEDRCESIAAGSEVGCRSVHDFCRMLDARDCVFYGKLLSDLAADPWKAKPHKLREISRWLDMWADEVEATAGNRRQGA